MNDNQNWERELLTELARSALNEQRKTRQWKIFFRMLWLLITVAIVVMIAYPRQNMGRLTGTTDRHVALLRLDGEISSSSDTADKLIQGLQDAYGNKGTAGIIIQANSPGGSPVLSGMVYDEITRQRKLHPAIAVDVVVVEMCASGCYYIASAANNIYVDKASIVGSIGVLSDGFGFTGLMSKLGIDRRLQTAGSNKGMGDPFSPSSQKQDAIRQGMLDDIHGQFIKAVRDGRGTRLKETPDMFSGMVWLGDKAIGLGLADGYGTVDLIARRNFKTDKVIDYTPQDDLSSRVARRFGVEFGAGIKSLFEDRFL